MTSKRRENKNLASFICFSFLIVIFSEEISRDEHTLVMLEEKIRMIKN